jgi:hypothetical protein
MERPITLHKCGQAIHRLGLAKAAGPDGLPAEFCKSFERLVVPDFHKTILEAHASGALPPTMREGDVVLKKDVPLCPSKSKSKKLKALPHASHLRPRSSFQALALGPCCFLATRHTETQAQHFAPLLALAPSCNIIRLFFKPLKIVP